VEHNNAQAAVWFSKAADQGDADSQFFVGQMYARGEVGVKKDLPLGKRYLELSAAQGCCRASAAAAALLKELRKCVACGKLDVHHMICSRCHNRRYCNASCQLQHWNSATDPHKLNCVERRE
jgi:TPR repeat protein